MSKKVFIKTFGCQMNEYDSDKMADVLHAAEGYEPTQDVEEADLILFNTCSVREKAQEKVFSDLGRVKHLKAKGTLIGVGGCVASQEGEALVRRAPYVDIVFGPQTLHRLPELIEQRHAQNRPQVDIRFPEIEKFDHLPPARVEGASAFVSIMEGCSKYCSYCVVPYTRGEEVSRPFDDVLVEVAGLADQGVREVTLLGQNVNAYGVEFGDRGAFAKLLRACGDVPGLERVRFTSPHPRDFTPDVIAAIEVGKNADPIKLEEGDRSPTEAVDGPTIALAESLVRCRAQEAGLAYELIAARADLSPIVVAARRNQPEPDVRTLRGWRRELVGEELLELLAGKRTISVGQGGRVQITPAA